MFGYNKLSGRGGLIALIAAAAVVTLSTQAMAAPSITFDDNENDQNGVISHEAGGPAIGTDIDFVSVRGSGTPLNDGEALSCIGCFLNFETGALVSSGGGDYEWAGPGTFQLTGELRDGDDVVVASGILVDGVFNRATVTGFQNSIVFAGFGTDTKNVDLLAYYGVSPEFAESFRFVNTQLSLGDTTFGADGSFTANVTNADLDNKVPVPGTLGLLGLGMVALGAAMRRNRSAQTA